MEISMEISIRNMAISMEISLEVSMENMEISSEMRSPMLIPVCHFLLLSFVSFLILLLSSGDLHRIAVANAEDFVLLLSHALALVAHRLFLPLLSVSVSILHHGDLNGDLNGDLHWEHGNLHGDLHRIAGAHTDSGVLLSYTPPLVLFLFMILLPSASLLNPAPSVVKDI